MTATKNEAPRDEKGRLICQECGGDKVVEVQGFGPSNAIEPTYYLETCEACGGRGYRTCTECGEPAKVVGANGVQAYCDVGHAWQDDNWSACAVCGSRPQHAELAPFCSDDCEDAFRRRIQRGSQLVEGRV
jgi:hypothetical protein